MWRPQLQIIPQGEPGGFNHNAAKYRCCCRCCHVKTGTLIIALLEAACALFQLINAVYFIAVTDDKSRGIVGIVAVVIVSIIIGLLLIGWSKEKAWLLLPHLFLQLLGIIVIIGLICYVFIASNDRVQSTFNVSYNDNDGETMTTTSIKAVVAISLAISLGFELFTFTVVFGCYRYFRDKANFLSGAREAVQNQQQPPPPMPPHVPQWGHPSEQMHGYPYPPPNGMAMSPMHPGGPPPSYAQNAPHAEHILQETRPMSPNDK